MLFSLKDVSYSYDQGRLALSGIELGIQEGGFYGVIGPNGSGKSTFLDLLHGHKHPDHGSVYYKSTQINSFRKKELAREIALVPQDFVLHFPFTVREVILMGRYPHLSRFEAPREKDIQIVNQALFDTDLVHLQDYLVTELSGGEKQRTIFARAIAQDTPVLLLDEATSSLDVKFGLKLLQLTQDKNKQNGKTVISVFHDINLAACFCDYLIFLKNGYVACKGPVQEVFNAEILQEVFEVRAKVYFEPYLNCWQAAFKTPDLKYV